MTGILKFFKPTGDGTVHSSKKAERPSTAREPFSQVGNTEALQRACTRLSDDADSDVVLVGEEVPAGSKRKREDNGVALLSFPSGGQRTDRVEPTRSTQQQQVNFKPAGPGDEVAQTHGAVETSDNKGASEEVLGPVSNSNEHNINVHVNTATANEATGPLSAAEQAPSSDEAFQPTSKRQRVPNDTDAFACSEPQNQSHPPAPQQHQQQDSQKPSEVPSCTPAKPPAPRGLSSSPTPQPSQHPFAQQPSASQLSADGATGGGDAGGSPGTAGGPAAACAGGGGGPVADPGTGPTGGGKSGAGAATLPPDFDLPVSLEGLRREAGELEAALGEEVLLESGLAAAAAACEGGRLQHTPTPAELCTWLEGRTQPLSQLVSQLLPLLPAAAAADPTSVRTWLVDLAQRKSYAAKEVALDGAAASEDATPGRLWVWEVREPRRQLADKATRKLVDLQRKRRKELRERLAAVLSAAEALSALQALLAPPAPGAKGPTAAARRSSESRAAKCWQRLGKLPELAAVEAAFRSSSGELTTGGAASARKERERKEKDETKAKQREEEARAKEAKRLQEEEAKRKAKEAAAASKAGFHSREGLRKSQNLMESFFKRSAAAKSGAAGPAGGAAAAAGGAAGGPTAAEAPREAACGGPDGGDGGEGRASLTPLWPSQQQHSLPGGAGPGGCSQPAAATPAREQDCPPMFKFSKLASRRQPDPSLVSAMDSAAQRLPLPAEQVARELAAALQRWRGQRRERKRMIGVPPSWSRRPSAPTDIRQLAAAYYGDVAALGLRAGGSWAALRTWRRKLIAFPKLESARPPFYGSFSKSSAHVTGRRPLGREPSLDYEVASDEEWEEEPEGESLSDSGDEGDSHVGAAGDVGEEEDDGFVVGDDHLSDDEGAQLSGDPDDPMDVDGASRPPRSAPSGPTRHVDPRLQQLEAAIERVRTTNRPVLLVRPQPPLPQQLPQQQAVSEANQDSAAAAAAVAGVVGPCLLRAEPRPGLNTGLDPALLGALRPVVHRPDVALAPPLEPDVYTAYAAAAAGGVSGWAALEGGVPAMVGAAEEAALISSLGGGVGGVGGGAGAPATAAGPHAGGVSARPPGSAPRGRTPGPSLSEAALAQLAEYLAGCADKNMEKVVEGFLATFPPGGPKPPAKIKVREAVKRLAAWSAPARRWQMHGGSVEEAVAAAVAAAAAAAAASAAAAAIHVGTPLSGATGGVLLGVLGSAMSGEVGSAQHLQQGALLALQRQVGAAMTPGQGGAALTPTPTPGGLGVAAGLPAPTPTPQLGLNPSRLLTPYTAAGAPSLLHAPACTPAEAGTAARQPRPTGQPQHLMPQHLAAALAKLAADAPPSASPLPSGTTANTNMNGGLWGAAGARAGATPVGGGAGFGGGGGGGALAPAATPSSAAVHFPVDGTTLQQKLLAAADAAPADPAAGTANAAFLSPVAPDDGGGGGGDAMECGKAPQPGQQQRGGSVPLLPGGNGGGFGEVQEAAGVSEPQRDEEGAPPPPLPLALPRPMPGAPPPLSELAALGTAHPHWRLLTAWLLGGGGAAARARRHGPAWADVAAALRVFEAGQLEPRLGAVPLEVARALLAVCLHRRSSHLRSGAFKALGNLAAALTQQATQQAAAAAAPPAAGSGSSPVRPARRRGAGRANKAAACTADAAAEAPPQVVARPTGQPSRCSPQPVTLHALLALPGLLEALRLGCCHCDPDSEVDKAARSASRVLAALAGVGIPVMSATAPFAAAQHGGTEDAAGISPELLTAAAAFRRRVAADPDLHTALRDAACPPSGPSSSKPTSGRCVFRAHMLLALQRLLRDPAAALLLTKTKERMAKERDAAAAGRAPPPPPDQELESKWAARLLQRLVAGGRSVEHPGCRKGLVQCAVALLEHPRLRYVLPAQAPEGDEPGAEGVVAGPALRGGWAMALGNDPRTQLPALCLTLLTSELRHAVSSYRAAEEAGEAAALDKCTCVRVLLGLAAAERALQFLARPGAASMQLLKQADTRAVVADMLHAIGEANNALANSLDTNLQSFITRVNTLAEELL